MKQCAVGCLGHRFRWRLGDASVLRSPRLVDSAFKLSPVRRALAEVLRLSDTATSRMSRIANEMG